MEEHHNLRRDDEFCQELGKDCWCHLASFVEEDGKTLGVLDNVAVLGVV